MPDEMYSEVEIAPLLGWLPGTVRRDRQLRSHQRDQHQSGFVQKEDYGE